MASKIKVDQLETADGTGTIALQNQLSGLTTASLPTLTGTEMPTGSTLQVVSSVNAANTSTNSTSYQATTLQASITPSSTSSKILVQVVGFAFSNGSATHCVGTIYRGSHELSDGVSHGLGDFYSASGAYSEFWMPMQYLDSPNTTSATTYKVYIRRDGSNQNVGFGSTARQSVMVLTEIKG